MITVDIEVCSVGRRYNFSLDEHAKISTLIAEIAEIVCQKEDCSLAGGAAALDLYSANKKIVLSRAGSLADYGIVNGSSLLLV